MTDGTVMRIALGQFFVKESSAENLEIVRGLIDRAEAGGAELLVLPEGIVARKPGVSDWGRQARRAPQRPLRDGAPRGDERPPRDGGLHRAGEASE